MTGADTDARRARGRLVTVLVLVATLVPAAFAFQRTWVTAASVGFAVVAAALRLFFAHTGTRGLTAFGLGAAALVAGGQEKSGAPFAIAAVAFVALSLMSWEMDMPAAKLLPRTRRLALAAIGVAAVLTAAAALAIPRLERLARGVLGPLLFQDATMTVGFGDRMNLGAMRGMLESDAVALRVFGAPADYLRGVVYDEYDRGRWRRVASGEPHDIASEPETSGGVAIEQRGGKGYFLPLGACAVGSADGPLAADSFALVTPATRVRPARVWFDPRCTVAASTFAPRAAGDADRALPSATRPDLERIARAWSVGATSPRARVEAIERHLRTEYRYSLDYERTPRRDPVLDFLEVHKEGHCEYFASALALLARASGVPARVVGGYRIGERNGVGGWWIVREKNAHAWVEVWLDDGWRTFDATPPSSADAAGARSASVLSALTDFASRAWQRASSADLARVGAYLVGAALAWLLLRRLWARARRARSDTRQLVPLPPLFARITDVLARRGHVRPSSEPIEGFAARLSEAGDDALDHEASALLLRYARLRYGGEGDLAELSRDVGRFVEQSERIGPERGKGIA